MTREGKNTSIKIELGRNNRIIVRIPYKEVLMSKLQTLRYSFTTPLLESKIDLLSVGKEVRNEI